MSKWRKHVTQSVHHVEAPREDQQIVQAIGSRGSNLIEVKLPSGQQTLCVLPNKFNKKLWIKRGGYLIIQHGDVDPQHSVTGTITSVLYDQDIRHLKFLQGVWPEEFAAEAAKEKDDGRGLQMGELQAALPSEHHQAKVVADADEYSSSDENLPPLQPNNNRPIREYTYSDDDTSSEEQ